MVANIHCARCGLSLAVPDGFKEPWLACPRCHERVANPGAFRANGPTRLTLLGGFGILLMVGGALGMCGGMGAILVDTYAGAMSRRARTGPSELEQLLINVLGFSFVIAAGVILSLASQQPARRLLLLGAGGAALVAAVLLLAFSGLIVVFATCFTGR